MPVSKSSFLNGKMTEKSRIAIFCIVGMFAGFLVSRVVLSVSMFLFGMNAIRDVHPREWLKQRWWLLGLGWVAMYAISYFWSDNKGEWGNHLQTKLPFLLLPLAFSYQPAFSRNQLKTLTISLGLMLSFAALYSMSFFLINPEFYIQEYHVSHLLPTLPKQDHIRCSLAMTLYIVWAVYVWPKLESKGVRRMIAGVIVLLVVYLHVLAAKTGLASLYLFFIAWGIFIVVARRKIVGLIILVAIPLVIILAIKFVPTLKERANYIDYTIYMFTHGDDSGNIGDIARIISYRLAVKSIEAQPLTGAGTGDMKHDMDLLYEQHYPQVPEHGRLLPHNQLLTIGVGAGVPAMLLFLLWLIAPLRQVKRNRQGFFFVVVWLLLFFQLMIEPVLEVQFGVFVFLYFLLLQMQELKQTQTNQEE